MLEYDRTDVTQGVDTKKTEGPNEWIIVTVLG